MSDRRGRIAAFLATAGWSGARRIDIAGDASFRRYARLVREDATAILMDAPPEREDTRPFLAVARLLVEWGYSAPRILAADTGDGLVLLEDLGDDSFNRIIAAAPAREAELYAAAVDLLADLHRRAPPDWLPPYGLGALLAEARLLSDWYLPAIGSGTDGRTLLDPLWRQLLAGVDEIREVVVLRDYHADNLMWLTGREGHARVGLLDFQDALAGHPAYDLVSLLQDARRDVAPALEEAMIRHYLAATGLAAEPFRRAYHLFGVQRAAKVIGIFTRLAVRDGKPRYLEMIPRVWGLFERNLEAVDLGRLKPLIDEIVPARVRRGPPPIKLSGRQASP